MSVIPLVGLRAPPVGFVARATAGGIARTLEDLLLGREFA